MAFDKFIDPNLFSGEMFPERTGRIQNPRFPNGYDLSYLLPQIFFDNEFWEQLVVATAEVFNELLAEPIKSLAYIRLPETQSRVYKALHAQMMAFHTPDELMTEELYDAVNNHVGRYHDAQGRDNFVRFIGWSLDIDLRLTRLWTKDYENFSPSYGSNNTIYDGGDWYPTTHVGLSYDMGDRTDITEQNLIDQFYKHAPIELVLKWVAKMQTFALGTLYLSVMTFYSVENRNHINGRGELDLTLNISQIGIYDILSTNGAANIPTAEVGLGVQDTAIVIGYGLSKADFIAWNSGDGRIVESPRISHRRASTAWKYTGPGKGEWVPENVARFNYIDPITNTNLGLRMETSSLNFVRSATKFGFSPWVNSVNSIGANVLLEEPHTQNLDGTIAKQWRTSTGTGQSVQEFAMTKQAFTMQIAYRKADTFINGRIDCLDAFGVATSLYPFVNQIGVDIGGGWRVFEHTVFESDANYLENTERLRITINLDTTPIEVYYIGIEPGLNASSFIETDDCNVGHRSADFVVFNVENDPRANRIQGTFGMSFALYENKPYNTPSPADLLFFRTEDVKPADGNDYNRAVFGIGGKKLTLNGMNITLNGNNIIVGGTNTELMLREVNSGELRRITISRDAPPPVSVKSAISWNQPRRDIVNDSPVYETEIGIKSDAITIESTDYYFYPQTAEVGPLNGFIDGLVWAPVRTSLNTTFALDW